jgi:hypothetical protein
MRQNYKEQCSESVSCFEWGAINQYHFQHIVAWF